MSRQKILLLSVSAGAGHVRAAEAIRTAALDTASLDVRHLDVMDFVSATFRKVYTDFYLGLVNKAPALWGYLYQLTNEAEADSNLERLRRRIERLNTRSLMREIRQFAPDAIICTHFLPAELLSRAIARAELHCPVWVQVTDFDLHRLWVQPHMAGYFTGNQEVAWRLQQQGIAATSIHVTGIPIMPAFGQPLDRAECAGRLGLDGARRTLLLMGGGAGLGSLDQVSRRLLEADDDFQLIVMAGRNQSLLDELQRLRAGYPTRLLPLGFTTEVERVMACADLVITKPGGLTTSECLAMGLPLIVNTPIPGQEEHNADFLLEQGVALTAWDAASLEYRVHQLLHDTERLEAMRRRARALGRPHAAATVLRHVCGS